MPYVKNENVKIHFVKRTAQVKYPLNLFRVFHDLSPYLQPGMTVLNGKQGGFPLKTMRVPKGELTEDSYHWYAIL